MAAEMKWTITKKATKCKDCGRVIPAGEVHLNIPKPYRKMAGDVCPECNSKYLYWGGHVVEMDQKGKRWNKPIKTQKDKDIAIQRISAHYGGREQ
jgi:uncharacterized protein with PIN domain